MTMFLSFAFMLLVAIVIIRYEDKKESAFSGEKIKYVDFTFRGLALGATVIFDLLVSFYENGWNIESTMLGVGGYAVLCLINGKQYIYNYGEKKWHLVAKNELIPTSRPVLWLGV